MTPKRNDKKTKTRGQDTTGILRLAANLWMHKLVSVPDSGPFGCGIRQDLFFPEDLGIDCIRSTALEPPDVLRKQNRSQSWVETRAVKAWDRCAKLAANRGVRVCWSSSRASLLTSRRNSRHR